MTVHLLEQRGHISDILSYFEDSAAVEKDIISFRHKEVFCIFVTF